MSEWEDVGKPEVIGHSSWHDDQAYNDNTGSRWDGITGRIDIARARDWSARGAERSVREPMDEGAVDAMLDEIRGSIVREERIRRMVRDGDMHPRMAGAIIDAIVAIHHEAHAEHSERTPLS